MTSGFYGPEDSGSSPFDDFLARIYGTGGPRQPAHRVNITRLMSAPARDSSAWRRPTPPSRAAGTSTPSSSCGPRPAWNRPAPCWPGPAPIRTRWSARSRAREPVPDPRRAAAAHPRAKRALLDAHQISRVVGSTYIGPEHILFALAANPESGAGRILSGARVTPETLQRALIGQGAGAGGPWSGGPGGRSATPRWTNSAAT